MVKRRLLTCVRLGRKCLRFRWSEVQADMERLKTLSIGAHEEQKKGRKQL